MSRAIISAECLSETQRISCRIPVGPSGLFGSLNDPTTSLLEVEDAYLSRLQEPAKIVAHSAFMSLIKINLALLLLSRREDLGPMGMARGGYSRLTPCRVLLTTAAFEVTGNMEVPGRLESSAVLFGGTMRFIPIYKATAVPVLTPEIPYAGEAIVVNRAMVVGLSSLEKEGA